MTTEGLVDVIGHCMDPQNADSEDDIKPAAILNAVRLAVPINGVVTDASIAAAKEVIEKFDLNLETFETAIENIK